MLLLIEIDQQKMIMGFELNSNHNMLGVIKDKDIEFLLGNFFINTKLESSDQSLNICLVFVNKIHFYTINSSNGIFDQEPLIEISHSSNFIINYSYNTDYAVLCCEMNNKTISFYDLSTPEKYAKEHNITLNIIPILNSLVSRFSYYYYGTKSEENRKKEIMSNFQSIKTKYSKSQIFLEVLYGVLYFICFSYENNAIYVYSIHDLNSLKLEYTINYQLQYNYYSTLQFVDNLVILYEFCLNEVYIYDIKSKNSNYLLCDSSQLTFNEGDDIMVNGRCIQINSSDLRKTMLYYVWFNIDKFYAYFPEEDKYNALISIIRRKRAQEYFDKYYSTSLVPKKCRIHFVQEVMFQMWENTSLYHRIKDRGGINEEEICAENDEKVIEQKRIIFLLSKLFEQDNNAEIMVNHFLIVYYNLKHLSYSPDQQFHLILLDYLTFVPIDKLVLFLNLNILPESDALVYYIISLDKYKERHSKFLHQTTLDYMYNVKLHESVFMFLYKGNRVPEALMYWKSLNITKGLSKTLKDVITKEKEIFSRNITIIRQFLISKNE